MEGRILDKVESKLNETMNEDINPNNIEYVYKLTKIRHMVKEDKEMNYGNYGGRNAGYNGYGNYGNYGNNYGEGSYGRRGSDGRYRGHDHLDRMYNDYGRYMDSRNRYGANEETDKSFHYMIKSLEDFIQVLHEEADTPQQKQMLNETLQRSMR